MSRAGARGGPKTPQDYADIIGAWLESAVENILTAGEQLHRAKGKLEHGEWARMFRDHKAPVTRPLPFSIRTGQRLIRIYTVFSALEATRVSLLPTAWGTLYELARVPESILTRAFEDGRIHPGMQRAHVTRLRYTYDPIGSVPAARPVPTTIDITTTTTTVMAGPSPWRYRDAVARLRDAVELEVSQTLSPDDWAALAEALRSIAKEIDAMAGMPELEAAWSPLP